MNEFTEPDNLMADERQWQRKVSYELLSMAQEV